MKSYKAIEKVGIVAENGKKYSVSAILQVNEDGNLYIASSQVIEKIKAQSNAALKKLIINLDTIKTKAAAEKAKAINLIAAVSDESLKETVRKDCNRVLYDLAVSALKYIDKYNESKAVLKGINSVVLFSEVIDVTAFDIIPA